jgi:hypothetical protein
MINFCKKTIEELDFLTSSKFAERYILRKCEFYHKFQNELITSSYHGLDFFSNIIKYYEDPDSYRLIFQENRTKKLQSIYEENFITLIKNNKK